MKTLIKWFNQLGMNDIALVGGKNASLGQMITHLTAQHIDIPDGFAITTHAYWYFIDTNDLRMPILSLLHTIKSADDATRIAHVSKKIQHLIMSKPLPPLLQKVIVHAYDRLCTQQSCAVAVRSSATAEDLPHASFAGLHESFLNIQGAQAVLNAVHACIASLFTPRAIAYRIAQHIAPETVAISVGIQRMIRSDKACAGVAFTLDTETGFSDAIVINASYGLGESVVKGVVIPDTMYVHKPTLHKGFAPVLSTIVGSKKTKLIYRADGGTKKISMRAAQQEQLCLTQAEVLHLARLCMHIETHYSQLNRTWTPMDIEWAKDGIDGKIYIVQARPETIHRHKYQTTHTVYQLAPEQRKKIHAPLLTGQAIGQHIVHGRVAFITSPKQSASINKGDIIVTCMTNPDWIPALKRASGLITELGGRTCHAAIVSRELGIPAIIGTNRAMHCLKKGQQITLDCSQGEQGFVYQGTIPFTCKTIDVPHLPKSPVKLLLNIAQPSKAFSLAYLPVDGVGLARTEFIIANTIKIHPLALVHPERTDHATRTCIKRLCAAYHTPKDYFVQVLAQEMSTIAAAFWPKPVYVRLSDFKSNEYRQLIGGAFFEPHEANPMLGLRGAARYYSTQYQEAFALECAAIVLARTHKGFENIHVMIPFVRTVDEMRTASSLLAKHGLKRCTTLHHIMMCELPANALLIKQFATLVNGFSIGSNDLTQFTLGVDRDELTMAPLFDEQNPAVKELMKMAITGAHHAKKIISICGQAPSDFPALANWLITQKIDAISLNADAVVPFLLNHAK